MTFTLWNTSSEEIFTLSIIQCTGHVTPAPVSLEAKTKENDRLNIMFAEVTWHKIKTLKQQQQQQQK